jgi:hypothetical protein
LWSVSIALVAVLGGLGWQLYSQSQQHADDADEIREIPNNESQNTQSVLEKYFTYVIPSSTGSEVALQAPRQFQANTSPPPATLSGNELDASLWADFVSLMPNDIKNEFMKCPKPNIYQTTQPAKLLNSMLCAVEKLMFDNAAADEQVQDKLIAAFFLMRGFRRRREGKTYRDVVVYDPSSNKITVTDPELLKELKEERDRPEKSKTSEQVGALKPEEGIPLGWLMGLLRSTLRRKGRQLRGDCKLCSP